MKRYLLFFAIAIGLASLVIAGEPDGPVLTFEQPGLNYGTLSVDNIPEGKITIVFTNTGNAPLVISNVRACCGTRVDKYPRQPIAPGLKDSVNVSFTLAKRPQRINRVVTITSNCSDNFSHTWRITGQVVDQVE